MRSPLVVHHRVNFVQNQSLCGFEQLSAFACSKQNEQRFGCRHQDVRRRFNHLLPFVHWRVARPHCDTNGRHEQTLLSRKLRDFGERPLEILMDVIAQGFEW